MMQQKPEQNGRFNEKIGLYDLNGNIKSLFRNGKTGDAGGVGIFGQMDNLLYSYNGNQLVRVAESGNTAKGFIEGTNTGDDYNFDVNGNMIHDLNKGIGSALSDNANKIVYNHLNLPERVQKSANSYVQYVYDATGRKLQQVAVDNGGPAKTTDYLGEFIYENNVLQFINHEEGRITMTGSQPEYQYHLKDHLGNVRVTFTSQINTVDEVATLEAANRASETVEFLGFDKVRIVKSSSIFDHTNGTANGASIRLSGNANEKIGLVKTLSVMPGDVINMEVYAKYVDSNTNSWSPLLSTLMSAISGGAASAVTDGAAYYSNGSIPTFPYPNLNGTAGSVGNGPKAFLNYIMFDKDFNPITISVDPTQTNYVRLSDAPKEHGQDVAHEKLSASVTVKQAGYMYIYLSNEEANPVEVYFDDLKVEQVKSLVIASNDYYPYGLTFNSYSRENSVPNRYLYNGKELQDELGLNWMDYGARMYDASIGRWFVLDPLSDKYHHLSPYIYVANNPIKYIDPDGKKIVVPNVADRPRILAMVNSQAAGVFAFNKKGEMYLVKTSTSGSAYFKNKLVEAINAKGSIQVKMGQTFKDNRGKEQDVDKVAGGGVTQQGTIKETVTEKGQTKETTEKAALVTISGNSNLDVRNDSGDKDVSSPTEILTHELVGHAIPYVVKSDTGNAVDNENKVRTELKEKKRPKDKDHVE